MQQQQSDEAVEMLERIIEGLIEVSQVEETFIDAPSTDTRLLAKRQKNLTENTEAISDSLLAVMKETFKISNQQPGKLGEALEKMDRATDYFEQGSRREAVHMSRESTFDLNETIVDLMKSHQQMCSGSGSGQGDPRQQMQSLSESQQGLNQSTKKLMEQMAGQQRLSHTDAQRLAQLAAQQEMIRQGLEDVMDNVTEAQELLGDLDQIGEDMKEVEEELQQKTVDPRIVERQQQILSRLLDAQRSIRQQEMSPQRQSQTATLAQRRSPPPIPQDLLRTERSLEEDVLRGADDRYPSQYRRMVEEYFRALSRENRNP